MLVFLYTESFKHKLHAYICLQNDFQVPLSDIPQIVTSSKYPERDPNLRDNWRGRSRKYSSNIDNQIIKVITTCTCKEFFSAQSTVDQQYSAYKRMLCRIFNKLISTLFLACFSL